MVVTEKTYIPPDEELTVQEINLSWPVLQAASFYLGKACEWENNVSKIKIINKSQQHYSQHNN